ncbi:MAG: hypothetical protein JWO19_2123 [Bryobacterales bacterium]|nr:hypothetical protein [Bryobacterales bacterium]
MSRASKRRNRSSQHDRSARPAADGYVNTTAGPSVDTPVSAAGPQFRPIAFLWKSSLRIDPYVFVLILLPIFVLWRDSNPIFTPVGKIDPWVYFGFFHNLVSFKRDLFPGTYYGSRLSWLLPGYVLNKLFPPLVANYILHLSVYYTALLALFSLLKTATNRQTALLGTILFGFYPYLWSAVGWDYADGAGIAWFLVTMVLLTRASAAPRRYGTLIAAGAVCAALVYSNLAWSLLCPTLLFYYVIRSRVQRRAAWIRALLEMGIWFGIGIALVTGILCLINHAIDGTYWFYAPSIGYALGTVGKKNPWKNPIAEWMTTARWLIFPVATVLLSLATGIFRRRAFFTRQNVPSILFAMQFLLAAGIMLWVDSTGDPLLQYPYYASYLIPFTFLVIGSQALRFPQLTKLGLSLTVVLTLVVLSLSWWVPADSYWARLPSPLWPFGIALLLVSAGTVLVGRVTGLVMVLAATGVLYSYILIGRQPANAARGSFIRIARGVHEIETIRQGRPVRFWFDAKEIYGPEFHSLNSTYLWGYTMLSSTFPALPKNVTLPSGTLLAVPSARVDAVEEVVKSYKSDGNILSLVSQVPIEAEGGRYSLSFLEVITDPGTVQELTVSFDEQGSGVLSVRSGEVHEPLPRERWNSCDEKTCKGLMLAESDGLHVTTSVGSWGYATMYSSLTIPTDGKYRFVLGYRMLSGRMYFGALKGDQSGWLTGAVSAGTGRDMRVECTLTLRGGDKVWLVTTNAEPVMKEPSTYVIKELRAFRYVDP